MLLAAAVLTTATGDWTDATVIVLVVVVNTTAGVIQEAKADHAISALTELDQELSTRGISLVFAELKDPVRRKIERYGLARTIEPRHFFPTIGAAIAAFRDQTGAEWTAVDRATDDRAATGT